MLRQFRLGQLHVLSYCFRICLDKAGLKLVIQAFALFCPNLYLTFLGEGPQAHLKKLAECIRWSYGLGIVLRLGNIARLELNYCIPMGVQSGDR